MDQILAFERELVDSQWLQEVMIPNYKYLHLCPIVATVGYLAMLKVLPAILTPKDGKVQPAGRPLKFVMALWNLFLSLGSALMLIGFLPRFLVYAQRKGMMEMICDTEHELFNDPYIRFYINLFIGSKFAELLDTFFLIVKNPVRPVPFLHYYHHASVLLFCWYGVGYFRYTTGMAFGIVNASVHTIMYFYYFLTELGYRPSWAIVITVIQISQMVLGIALNTIWAVAYFNGKNCECTNPPIVLTATAVMYGSYLYLFVQFFLKRYSAPKSGSGKGKQE